MWLGVFQGLFFLLPLASTPSRLIGIALAIATLLAYRHGTISSAATRTAVISGFAGVAAVNFVVHLQNANGIFPFRVWQIAIVLGYAITFIAFAVAFTRAVSFSMASVICGIPAVLLLVAEASVSGTDRPAVALGDVEWTGEVAPDLDKGTYFAPNTVVRSLYPANPRNYFEEPSTLKTRWKLNTQNGSVAELAFPDDRVGVIRVAIAHEPEKVDWHIELRQSPIRLQENAQYELRFRARADSVRSVFAAVALAYEPWSGLGFFSEFRIDTTWKSYARTFRSTASDSVARLFFNLGAELPSVELSDVSLRALSTGKEVQADVPVERSVTYRLNSQGCRGSDVPNRDSLANTRRILALGDGSTMGVGVHERDTYVSRLQSLLNEAPGRGSSRVTYDVLNCGAWGSSTSDQIKISKRAALAYHPNVVLLSVSPDDFQFSKDEGVPQQRPPEGQFARLFRVWGVITTARQPKVPPPDLSPIVAGLRQIATDVQASGAQFGVMLFRNRQGDDWTRLDSALATGLGDLNVPILDLGPTLLPFGERETMVDPRFDTHPNDLAHRLAAEALRKFLLEQGMLNMQGGQAAPSVP